MVQLFIKFVALPCAAALLFLLILAPGNTLQGSEPEDNIEVIKLPAPDKVGAIPLETALQNRRSVRSFGDEPIALQSVSQLLWAAQGITSQHGLRTAPSAGALYPLELYVVAEKITGLEKGVYLYKPGDHALVFTRAGQYLHLLARAALHQGAINNAPAVFVLTGIQKRTTGKYGDRGVRYMHMEAGHAAQNLCLQAVPLGLGAVPIGAFSDQEVAMVLHLERGVTPLYIIPTGKVRK